MTDAEEMGAWEALYRGELDPAQQLVHTLPADAPWALTLRQALSQAGRSAPVEAPHPPVAGLARGVFALEMTRLAQRRFDARQAKKWLDIGEPFAEDEHLGEALALERWLHSISFGDEAQDEPRRRGESDPVLRILRVSMRALFHERRGELDDALKSARQASRMGRTEALPYAEHFAHLTLARVRRLIGQPHLATRILVALARYAVTSLDGWLRYELTLSAGHALAAQTMPTAPLALDPGELLASAERGDAKGFANEAERLLKQSETAPWAVADIRSLCACLGVNVADEASAAWVRGQEVLPPRGLHGAAGFSSSEATGGPFGFIETQAGAPGRRLLYPATVLRGPVMTPTGQARVDAARAVLALAGAEGLEIEALFLAVYGFRYNPKIHSGSLRVVLHRLRDSFPDMEILRDGGHIAARMSPSQVLPDPRCVHSVHDRLLRFVAAHPGVAARDVVKELGIAARTAQRALANLVEEGWCQRSGSGPTTAYHVEDTTFSEPTQTSM